MIASLKSRDSLVLVLDEGRHRTPVKLISADDHVCYVEFLENCPLLDKDAGAKAWDNPADPNRVATLTDFNWRALCGSME